MAVSISSTCWSKARARRGNKGFSRQIRLGRYSEARLGVREQFLEARITSQHIKVGIDFGMPDVRRAQRRLEIRFQHLEGAVWIIQIGGEPTGEIIAHIEVVGIEQQRSVDPFLASLLLTDDGQRRRSGGENCGV